LSVIACRLCNAAASFRFTRVLMQKYEVDYFECTQCRSLQTEKPYWLDHAYANPNSVLDVGRAQRNVLTAMLCAYILRKLGVVETEMGLDWGGAEGLFCRLMRDRGFNFFTYDKYIEPLYSEPYRIEDPAAMCPIVTITAFEVLEHLPEPAQAVGEIFALHPRLLFCTTELYEGQGNDWYYLSPINGRHCFFYSSEGMQWIANRFGYRYIQFPFLHLFGANEIWEAPALDAQRIALDALTASKASIFADAGQSLVTHLAGDAWRHITDDYFDIRKKRFGL
jgi:hypothetical protein